MLRILSGTIVLFWLLMMGLLLRTDVFKKHLEVLDVPPDHVLRLMFLHEQNSDLEILQDGEPVGYLKLRPHRPLGKQEAAYRLIIDLNVLLPTNATGEVARLNSEALLDFTEALDLLSFKVRVGIREKEITGFLEYIRAGDRLSFEIQSADRMLRRWSGPPGELQNLPELKELGFGAEQLEQVRGQVSLPTIRATKGELSIKGEKIDAYVLVIGHADTFESSIYCSQLGQVLKIELFTGQSLVSEGVDP